MSKHEGGLEQKSSAQPGIRKDCGALDDKDLAKVTGGDKSDKKVTPKETVAFAYGQIEFQYSSR